MPKSRKEEKALQTVHCTSWLQAGMPPSQEMRCNATQLSAAPGDDTFNWLMLRSAKSPDIWSLGRSDESSEKFMKSYQMWFPKTRSCCWASQQGLSCIYNFKLPPRKQPARLALLHLSSGTTGTMHAAYSLWMAIQPEAEVRELWPKPSSHVWGVIISVHVPIYLRLKSEDK